MKKVVLLILMSLSLYANRFVVLDPSAVEILIELGAKDDILAIAPPTMLDIYPSKISKAIPSVGTYTKPNIEKIISLKPELVILSDYSTDTKAILEDFKIKTLSMKVGTLDSIKENIKTLATLSNKQNQGELMLKKLERDIKDLQDKRFVNKSILLLSSYNPPMVYCKDNIVNDLVSSMNLVNVCDKNERNIILNIEYILSKDPDFILYMGSDDDFISKYPSLKLTKAYKNNKIINIFSSKLLRASHRIVLSGFELKNEILR